MLKEVEDINVQRAIFKARLPERTEQTRRTVAAVVSETEGTRRSRGS